MYNELQWMRETTISMLLFSSLIDLPLYHHRPCCIGISGGWWRWRRCDEKKSSVEILEYCWWIALVFNRLIWLYIDCQATPIVVLPCWSMGDRWGGEMIIVVERVDHRVVLTAATLLTLILQWDWKSWRYCWIQDSILNISGLVNVQI